MIEFWRMTSQELRNFLIFNKRKTYVFWFENLKTSAPGGGHISENQLHYGARFLARSSTIPVGSQISLPTVLEVRFPSFATLFQLLTEVLSLPITPEVREIAACQILILSGFYQEYAKKHYNMDDLAKLGASFFREGAVGKRKEVIKEVASNFKRWQNLLAYLKYNLDQDARLIHVSPAIDPIIKIVSR